MVAIHNVGKVADFELGIMRSFRIDNHDVAVVNLDGTLHAIQVRAAQ